MSLKLQLLLLNPWGNIVLTHKFQVPGLHLRIAGITSRKTWYVKEFKYFMLIHWTNHISYLLGQKTVFKKPVTCVFWGLGLYYTHPFKYCFLTVYVCTLPTGLQGRVGHFVKVKQASSRPWNLVFILYLVCSKSWATWCLDTLSYHQYQATHAA